MKNLEDLGLVEMNAQEVNEVEGGIVPIILAVILIGGSVWASWNGNHPNP